MLAVGEIFVLLGVALLLYVFIAPLILFAKAAEARQANEDLKRQSELMAKRLSTLETSLEKLRSADRPAASPTVAETPVPTPSAAGDLALKLQSAAPPPLTPVARPGETPDPTAAIPELSRATVGANSPEAAKLPPPATPREKIEPPAAFNWEQFLGVKLFAWLGGLIAFLGVAFALKYSFDQGWVSPAVRVLGGGVVGLALLVGGRFLDRERYAVTIQSLCAAGILVLYADIFAAHSFYQLIPSVMLSFLLMIAVTVTAFLLSVRLNAQVVAVLGLLGGFLTPVLLSTGTDRTLALFGYLALLDAGLVAVALRQRWNHLAPLAAGATALMIIGWTVKFFGPERVETAMAIYLAFTALFVTAFALACRWRRDDGYLAAAGVIIPVLAGFFIFVCLTAPTETVTGRPGLLFGFALLIDLAVLVVPWLRVRFRVVQVFAGGAAFGLLGIWMASFLTNELLYWGLGLSLVFGALHAALPVVLQRLRPDASPLWWSHLFPLLALLLALIPFAKLSAPAWGIWPFVLLLDALAMALAILTMSLASVIGALALTFLAAVLWVLKPPVGPGELDNLFSFLAVTAGFAAVFYGAGMIALRKGVFPPATDGDAKDSGDLAQLVRPTTEAVVQLSATAGIMPFLLLSLIVVRLPLENPSAVFTLAAGLVVMLLAVVRSFRVDWLAPIALVSVLALEMLWHGRHNLFNPTWIGYLWNLGFALMFFAFPFLFRRQIGNRKIVWAVAALALPLHFWLLHTCWLNQLGRFDIAGIQPALLALPLMWATNWLWRHIPADEPARNTLLALMGGAALFFITLIFPVQFDRQWVTLGWALEGVALLWFLRRVPHEGLKLVGVGLLVVAFIRLGLNPLIFDYERSGMKILNWYLYTYGVVIACLFGATRLLAPPRHRLLGRPVLPWLHALGGWLAFVLLNVEIADFFTTGRRLEFHFSASLAQDMTYSLAWAGFALALMGIGFRQRLAPARRAGMALLVVTILKLFFHDLWRLGGLYRIGSLIGLAIVLGLVSFFYQRMLALDRPAAGPTTPPQNAESGD